MANTRISALTSATTPLAGTEVLPIVQSSATVKVAVSDLTAGRSISVSGLTNTGLTASRPVFTDASKLLTSTGVVPIASGGTNASTASITSFNNITGYTASGATGTTSTNLVFSTSPTLVTPNIGNATGTQLNIDNLRLDGNTVSSQDTNGAIELTPNGTGQVRATNSLVFRSNNLTGSGRIASNYVAAISTTAVVISPFNGTWGHVVIVTGLSTTGGNFFTDLVFSCATAGPTVLSSKTVSGGPAGRTYSMSGSDTLQLAMASGTYEVYSAFLYGVS